MEVFHDKSARSLHTIHSSAGTSATDTVTQPAPPPCVPFEARPVVVSLQADVEAVNWGLRAKGDDQEVKALRARVEHLERVEGYLTREVDYVRFV